MLRLIYAALFDTEKKLVPDAVGGMVGAGTLGAGIWSLIQHRPNFPLLCLAVFLLLKQFVFVGDAD